MENVNLIILLIGALVLLLGLISALLKRIGLPAPMLAMLIGTATGPTLLNIFQPGQWGSVDLVIEEAARITLGITLVGVALRLPEGFIRRSWRPLFLLLGPGMIIMWLTTSALIYWIIGLSPLVSLLVGAALTPTDPVIASSITSGKVATGNLPERMIHLFRAESGLNDGLAYPFLLLPVLLLSLQRGAALHQWAIQVLLWQVGAAILIGFGIGYISGKLLEWAEKEEIIEQGALLAYTIALALVTLSTIKLLGSDGVLAVFVATIGFGISIGKRNRTDAIQTADTVEEFFILPIFALFGIVMPWPDWFALGWPAVFLVLAVIFLRRIPELLLAGMLTKKLHNWKESLFFGWFGPIGVSAMFYAAFALRKTGIQNVWIIASLIIAASTIIHGLTATPFTRWFGKVEGKKERPAPNQELHPKEYEEKKREQTQKRDEEAKQKQSE
jgi:NhaP-type Na+/H+ or K+/H+ antiporter